MSTLLIELAGPQQAWGSRSRFAVRATELAPTRSGVIGLIAAALGYERTASLERFARLRFGVRIDQPGTLERDFQTARSLDGSAAFPLSQRFYLADAVFLAGLESDDESELRAFRDALARPYFPLFLGRRAFPPGGPLRTDLVAEPLAAALQTAAWRARTHHQRQLRREPSVSLQLVLDARLGDPAGESRRDVPVSFDPRRREYGWRDLRIETATIANPLAVPEGRDDDPEISGTPRVAASTSRLLGSPTDHDPETLLSDEEV